MSALVASRVTRTRAGLVALALLAVAGVSVSIYAWQQNRQLSADVTTKNSQIADLQKQAAAPAKTTPTQTTPADPYAGWQSATLKYEKVSLKYPSTWKLTSGSTPSGAVQGVNPGTDYAKLVSPTGLTLMVNTGIGQTDSGPSCGTMFSVTPIATLGGSYYLGYKTNGVPNPSGTTTLTTGFVCMTADGNGSWPSSKNIKSGSGASLSDAVTLSYTDAQGSTIAKPVSTFQSDASYNDALLIIKSLSY